MYSYLPPDSPPKLRMRSIVPITLFSVLVGFFLTFVGLNLFLSPTSISLSMFSPGFLFAAAAGSEDSSQENIPATSTNPVILEPSITDIEASSEIAPGDTITVRFNTNMGGEDASPLTFDMLGGGKWLDEATYQFTVGDISPDQTYHVRLLQGFVAADGTVVNHDNSYEFHSAKSVQASFASDKSEYSVHDSIEISFNQPVDEKSAEDAFIITPAAKGSFSWKDDTLIFTPEKLSNQSTYKITMDAGIKPFHGFPSVAASTLTIDTSAEITKLNVPYFSQQYKTSCEASALRMALAYYKIVVNDIDLVRAFGYNPRPFNKALNEWDDPHKMFVGEVDVSDINKGYGVYGEPVSKAAETFGRKAAYVTTITPARIAKEIRAGHPIVIWGYTSLTLPAYTWNTPDGGQAKVLKGEHARTIVGVMGSTNNPLGFYLHDPSDGSKFEYWSADKLMNHFNSVPGVTNQAVIVS